MSESRDQVTLLALPFLFLSLLLLSTTSAALASGPTVLYAKPGGKIAGACNSWSSACDLQYVLTNAVAPAELWVMKGTYKPSKTGDTNATFLLKSGIGLYGGFAGTEKTRGTRNPTTNITTLSGNLGNIGGIYYNSSHVVTATGIDSTAVLDGFTITGGDAFDFNCPLGCGAGLYNDSGSPTLTNVILTGNIASVSGGGMYNDGGSPTLTKVTFSANQTTDNGDGAGMYNNGGNPTLTKVTFSSNKADGSGGGMYNASSSPTLNNVTFGKNKAGAGGGLYNDSGSNPTLVNTTFSNNSAHDGGGMSNDGGSPTLTNVTFSGNTASSSGGMSNTGGSPVLTNVTFSRNSALVSGGMGNSGSPTLTNVAFIGNQATACAGGGMTNVGTSSPTLTNVTFSGNRADNGCGYSGGGGGGLFNMTDSGSSTTLTNVTFSNNSISGTGWVSTGPGGAIDNEAFGSLTIRNSIIWGNSPSSGAQVSDVFGTLTISDSVVQGGCLSENSCSNIITTNPHLQPLALNGGAIKTFALGAGSSAINKGNVAFCPATDQRGKPRRTAHGYCDIGAYEAQPSTISVKSGTPQTAPINTAFAKPLVVTVRDAYQNLLGGVLVTYSAPASGASVNLAGNPATSNALGLASVTATANGTRGQYKVTAKVTGLSLGAVFNLTNK